MEEERKRKPARNASAAKNKGAKKHPPSGSTIAEPSNSPKKKGRPAAKAKKNDEASKL